MPEEIRIPEIGENVESGVVVAVHIEAGQTIAVDEPVIELETDKAVVEIPSPVAGVVAEVFAKEGEEMKVGDVIATVDPSDDADEKKKSGGEEKPPADAADDEKEEEGDASEPEDDGSGSQVSDEKETDEEPAESSREDSGGEGEREETPEEDKDRSPIPAAPSIRRLARELGLDLGGVTGSGPGGRITETDVKARVKERMLAKDRPGGDTQPDLPDFKKWGETEAEPLETVRRLTAVSTARSWRQVPHVTQFDEADITDLFPFIEKHAKSVEQKGGKLTITAVVAKVCAEALTRFPRFNASLDMANERLILKKYVHISLAVDTPRGLLMPVIRDVDKKGISQIALEISDIAERARNKKIRPEELEGGTFSISNQGSIGGVNFTPIVLWPQAAIVGMSRSSVRSVYMEGEFRPRTLLPLSVSYDHRIIDGADAARFLGWICDSLARPMTMQL